MSILFFSSSLTCLSWECLSLGGFVAGSVVVEWIFLWLGLVVGWICCGLSLSIVGFVVWWTCRGDYSSLDGFVVGIVCRGVCLSFCGFFRYRVLGWEC